MPALPGRVQTLEVSNDSGTTWVKVGKLQDAELSRERNTIDTTNKDDGEFNSFVLGTQTNRITGTVVLDESDQGQQILEQAYENATTLKFRWRNKTGTGFKQYTADGIVTRWPTSAPVGGAQTHAFEVQITGAVTSSNQP